VLLGPNRGMLVRDVICWEFLFLVFREAARIVADRSVFCGRHLHHGAMAQGFFSSQSALLLLAVVDFLNCKIDGGTSSDDESSHLCGGVKVERFGEVEGGLLLK
jgi:hypothetical protein